MTTSTPAFVIGHITVKDESLWAEYRIKVPATLASSGGSLVFRGKQLVVLGGRHEHSDTVVVRFLDRLAVEAWFTSAAYQALIPLRERAADLDLVSFEASE